MLRIMTTLVMVAETIFVSKICNFWQDGWFYGEIMAPWRLGKGSINYIVPLDPKAPKRKVWNLIKNRPAGVFLLSIWSKVCGLIPVVKFKIDSLNQSQKFSCAELEKYLRPYESPSYNLLSLSFTI